MRQYRWSTITRVLPYRICWDAPKSMHTLEVDICMLKTCLEVIICRPTIIILLSKVKYKMYASMYIIVHKI